MPVNTTTTDPLLVIVEDGDDYLCSNIGILLPILDESEWSPIVRTVLYLIGLLFFFLGISIAADVFMCAIERITSQTRTVKVKLDPSEEPIDGEHFEETRAMPRVQQVAVWNPTMANLTLMALGSSAPEILLSIIEIVGNKFKAGRLGPSTIVGSAAFNLLVITATCIVSVPNGQTRAVADTAVFTVTASCSVLAYAWLFVVLKVTSPGVIEVWEAVTTLLLFVVLLVVAYMADRGPICGPLKAFPLKKLLHGAKGAGGGGGTAAGGDGNEELATPAIQDQSLATEKANGVTSRPHTAGNANGQMAEPSSMQLRRRNTAQSKQHGLQYLELGKELAKGNPDATAEEVARLTAMTIASRQHHSRNYYRVMANRWLYNTPAMFASKPASIKPTLSSSSLRALGSGSSRATSAPRTNRPLSTLGALSAGVDVSRLSVVEFSASKYCVSEADTHVRLKVIRSGRISRRILFNYETIDGTAKMDENYIPQSETLVFNPSETEKVISVQVLGAGDHKKEPDECFYARLGLEDLIDGRTVIGPNNLAMINIVDNKEDKQTECRLQFLHISIAVNENCGTIQIPVIRKGNPKIKCSVGFCTVDGTAKSPQDYIGGVGHLEFDQGEVEKYIYVDVIDDKEFEKHETFKLQLTEASDGAAVSSKRRSCLLTLLNDDRTAQLLTQSDRLVDTQLSALQPGAATWRQQFAAAANVNGGDLAGATRLDYLLHVLTFFWKLLFAFVPPPSLLGGWPTFVIALTLIGCLTALTGDLAGIFGCLIGLPDSVTAITIVALGTSLPDLFASRLAARRERTADSAIGNITGSNSVNVFLGLGLGWLIASVHWQGKGKSFVVPAAELSFTVVLYTFVALLCIGLLVLRRLLAVFGRAELGGPTVTRWLCFVFLVGLWLAYISLSSLQAVGYIEL